MQRRPNPYRRPMSRQAYEALQRQRRQNRIAIAIIAGLAVIIVAAVILILRPKGAPDPVAPVAADAPQTQQAQLPGGEYAGPGDDAGDETGDESGYGAGDETGDGALSEDAVPDEGGEDDFEETGVAGPLVTPAPAATRRPDGALRSVRMRVVGDIMMCQSQLVFAKNSGYDFHNQFELIADVLQNADYTMGNMEGTVGRYGKKAYSGYPLFNCPHVVLQALKDDGVDFLTLANNHMLDRWFDGMKNTVNWVEQYGFDHVGAYRTRDERNSPVIYEIGGIKFGFVAYTHTTNTQEKVCDPDAVKYGVPYLYKADIDGDIQRLRAAGAEVVIAFPHWGKEYVREPDSNQKKYAKKLAQAGADIIIGSHSHMVQPMGYQTVTDPDGRVRKVFTMFSMGNFISDHIPQYTDNGIVLDFTVNENADGTFTCDDVGYIPTYTWKQDGAVKVLPSGRYLDQRPAGMDNTNYKRMVESYKEIVEIIGDNFQPIAG